MANERIDWRDEIRRRGFQGPPDDHSEDSVEELAQHLEQQFAHLLATGVDPQLARLRVLAEITSDAREVPTPRPLAGWDLLAPLPLMEDLRYATRMFARRPGFTAIVVLAIALGVASITAVFSLINAVLLRPFPAVHFDRTVLVWKQDLPSGRDRLTQAPLEYAAFGAARAFDAVGAARGVQLNVTVGEEALAVSAVQVTPSLFGAIGVEPVIGRRFSEGGTSEMQEVLVTSEFWQRHLGGDPQAIGRTLSIRGGFTSGPPTASVTDGSYVIVGVLPAGVSLPYRPADIWIPLASSYSNSASTVSTLLMFARLKEDVTLAAARTEVSGIIRQLAVQYPERHQSLTATAITWRDESVGDIAPTLMLLAASVALLAVLVCANVGNLLLTRLTERQREMRLRAALGATTGRMARQLLVESLILGIAGGIAGVAIAHWIARVIAVSGPATIPRVSAVSLDLTSVLVAATATLVLSVAFGLIPALGIRHSVAGGALSQRSGSSLAAGRLREGLTVAQFAVAFIVLVGAGLVFNSARALERTAPGYDPRGVLTGRIALPQSLYQSPERRTAFFTGLLDRLRAVPGVSNAGAANTLPQMADRSTEIDVDGPSQRDTREPTVVRWRMATPGFLESLGVPVIAGRTFQDADLSAGAAVVSRSMADRLWSNGDAMGRRIRLASPGAEWLPIVGIVDDVRQWINSAPEPTLYIVGQQQSELFIVIRTSGDPMAFANTVVRAVRDIDRDQPVSDLRTMEDRLAASQEITYERFRTAVMAGFGFAAFALAGLGIFGVVRYTAMQRTSEFGIRMALGASARQIFMIVVTHSLRIAAVGAAIAIPLSFALTRVLRRVLFGGEATESVVIVAVTGTLVLLGLIAALGPAWRAAHADPMHAVRAE